MHKIIYPFLLVLTFSFNLFIQGCKDESDPVTPPSDHFDPVGWIITNDQLETRLVVWQGSVVSSWQSQPVDDTLTVIKGILSEHLNVAFLKSDSTIMDPPQDADFTFGFAVQDTSIISILADEAGGWGFHINGKLLGFTAVEFQVRHLGHVDIRTPYIPVRVAE